MTEARLHLIAPAEEIAQRRARAPKGVVVEAWPDVGGLGFWIGAESKAALDAAGEGPVRAKLSLPASSVPIYYGPRLCDIESLPREESLQTRVLSVHAIAVAWITLDRFGQRASCELQSPSDPTFHLRRPGTAVGHLWRLFHTKSEAAVYLHEAYGDDSAAHDWAQVLPHEDFDALIRHDACR